MANPTIGFIICPFTGEKSEVRRDKKRKLYYYGSAGLVKPNLPEGQNYMKKHTDFIGENGEALKPVNENKPEKPVINDSVNEQKPVKEKSLLKFLFTDE